MHKNCTPEELASAIRTVDAGNTTVSAALAQRMLAAFKQGEAQGSGLALPLTERELKITKALAQGKSNKQIAQALYISENTVCNHTANIYKKLQINNRNQAILYVVREGLLHRR